MDRICPLCAATETALFPSLEDRDNNFDGGYRLYSCTACGVVFTYPMPSNTETLSLYGKDYYSFTSSSLESLPIWRYVARALVPTLRFLQDSESRCASSLEMLLFRILRNVPQIVPLFFPGRDVLDLGCGGGDQMALWREAGLNVWGVDISPHAAAEGSRQGLRIFTGEIWEADFAEGSFDIVYANQVIEHTREIRAALQEIWRVLKPGGVLIVGVPNGDNRLLALFGSRWAFLQVPHHLLHFSTASLPAALARDGFAIRQVYTITPAAGLLESMGKIFPRFEAIYARYHLHAPCVAAYVLLSLLLLPFNLRLRGDLVYVVAVKGALVT